MQIAGSVALVTGANRGIGRAFVPALLERGARRVYATARNVAALEVDDPRIVTLPLDLTQPAQIAAAAEQAGDVTLLINNASIAEFADPLDADRDALAREMTTNYLGTIDVTRAFVPVLERQEADTAVLMMLSLLSLHPSPRMSGYSASKAAAYSITQSLRPGLARRGIGLHAAYPGGIDTEMISDLRVRKSGVDVAVTGILDGIEAGEDDIFPDPVAEELGAVWWEDPRGFGRMLLGQPR